jgi:phytoene dehydrogenase-like protein
LFTPLVRDSEKIVDGVMGPLRPPRHPVALARFGVRAVRSTTSLATGMFDGERARALFAGIAAHSMLALERAPTAAYGLMLAVIGHAIGWPIPRGGSQKIVDALVQYLESLGGEVVASRPINSLDDLPPHRAALFDVTPRQLLGIAGDALPSRYRGALARYRYGPGVFKMDWAIDGPIPWKAEECGRAGTVHLGGRLEDIAASEAVTAAGQIPERPYMLIGQQSLFDSTRAPSGKHTVWGYCHVPNGSTVNMVDRMEAQLERFAPGFKDIVLERSIMSPARLQEHNANCVGGDINGGVADIRQLFTRPVVRLDPYSTPNKSIYICSSSTPPSGGVHGMCGYYAARSALRRAF